MIGREIKVFAPATISNIACGFDIMGFAIDYPGDELVLRVVEKKGVKITKITGDAGKLPLEAEKNTAGMALIKMLEYLNVGFGVEVEINKKMALGSGLGSSAASAVAGVFALNKLLEKKLTKKELTEFALKGEEVASKAIHADNVGPCLYGGFTLIRGYDPVDIIEIPTPDDLYCTVIHPEIEIKTSEARALLPKEVELKKAITQWGNVGGLISGLYRKDYDLISRSLNDVIIEPVRAALIPNYYEIKNAANNAGALGCNISGSGPSIFALSIREETANLIGDAMKSVVDAMKVESTVYISKINKKGPRVI
ncbi:MAG: homoserine kinase [Melioribacteraceae bacterium]|nr:homoserine kinase [Melioribacteraceae bacterium]